MEPQTTPLSGSTITWLRYFSYYADGRILTRRDGTLDGTTFTETANSRQHYAYADGQQVAILGEDGTIVPRHRVGRWESVQRRCFSLRLRGR